MAYRLLLMILALASGAVVEPEYETVEPETTLVSASEWEYEEREQGPTAWACTDLDTNEPWDAYDHLEIYIFGGNQDNEDLSEDVTLFPIQEIYSSTPERGSDLCIYLQKQHHCFPPLPLPGSPVRTFRIMETVVYYDVRIWGHTTESRTEYYKRKLLLSLDNEGIKYNEDYYILSYFPNHVREVRVDPVEDIPQTGVIIVPDTGEETEGDTVPDKAELVVPDTGEETVTDTGEETVTDTGEETVTDTGEETVTDTGEETVPEEESGGSVWTLVEGVGLIKVNFEELNRAAARQACKDIDGDLYSAMTTQETMHLMEYLNGLTHSQMYWLGAEQDANTGHWNWINSGRLISAAEWTDEFGCMTKYSHKCVEMDTRYNQPLCNDMACDEELRSVCEPYDESKSPFTWVENVGHIKVFQTPKSWSEARESCKEIGGDLYSARTSKETAKLLAHMIDTETIKPYWAGAEKVDGRWTWLDTGRSLSEVEKLDQNGCFTTAYASECVEFDSVNNPPLCNDKPCDDELPFICRETGVFSTPFSWVEDVGYIKVIETPMSWVEAQSTCKGIGGELYSSKSPYDTMSIGSHVANTPAGKTPHWVGIRKVDNQWKWLGTGRLLRETEAASDYGCFSAFDNECAEMDMRFSQSICDDLPCTNELPFICMETDDRRSPYTWVEDLGAIKVNEEPMTRDNARKFCREIGGDLFSARTAKNTEKLISYMGSTDLILKPHWAGVEKVDGQWRWMDTGRPLAAAESSSDHGCFSAFSNDCVEIDPRYSPGLCDDQPCSSELPSICKEMDVAPPPFSWVDNVGYIAVIKTPKTWDAARVACKDIGGDIFTTTSPEQSSALSNHMAATMTPQPHWAGVERVNGQWKWLDTGRPLAAAESSSDHGCFTQHYNDCVEMDTRYNPGICDDFPCDSKLPTICKEADD